MKELKHTLYNRCTRHIKTRFYDGRPTCLAVIELQTEADKTGRRVALPCRHVVSELGDLSV